MKHLVDAAGLKVVGEQIEKKQDELVSGINLKTINSESLLGSGNIAIASGTKLYRHDLSSISFNYVQIKADTSGSVTYSTSSSDIFTLCVYSTSGKKYETGADFISDINSNNVILVATKGLTNSKICNLAFSTQITLTISEMSQDNDGLRCTSRKASILSADTLTDTVTAL